MEENKIIIQRELSIEDIKNLIYTIRGKQVMLDRDLAKLYCCKNNNGQIFERLSTLEYKQFKNEENFNKVFNLLQKKRRYDTENIF